MHQRAVPIQGSDRWDDRLPRWNEASPGVDTGVLDWGRLEIMVGRRVAAVTTIDDHLTRVTLNLLTPASAGS